MLKYNKKLNKKINKKTIKYKKKMKMKWNPLKISFMMIKFKKETDFFFILSHKKK